MGTPNRPGVFRLRGVWAFGAGQVLLPLPLDMQVVFDSARSDEGFVALALHLKPDVADWGSDGSPYRFDARKRQKSESPQGFVVREADWRHFALAGEEARPVTSLRRWIDETMRIGIARNPLRGTAEEHMLYRLPMATFSERAFEEALKAFEAASFEASDPHSRGATVRYGLAAAVSSTALPPDRSLPPWLRLGGENRPWRAELSRDAWSPLSDQVEEEVIRCIEETGVARLILLTPAIWERGDRPKHYDPVTRRLALGRYVRPANASLEAGQEEERVEKEPEKETTKNEAEPSAPEVEVLAVATGRPLLVGGWDIVRNRPKPRLPAVPAGTVLVVRVPEGQARMLAKAVCAAALTDDLSWEGYGFVTVGAYCDDRLRL
ncbi:MAG: hypothetical protein IMX03_07590 [Brockia lithotrophica]|nr:hypothetical protein [Brockia lithotrophica]